MQPASSWRERMIGVLTLFTSSGTLICCALPAALAALAGGAAVASLVSTFPWLIPLSQQKDWIFLGAGGLLFLNGLLVFRPQHRWVCRIAGGSGCKVAGRFTRVTFWIALGIYSIGAFFAYALTPLLRWLES
ncbi:MAG: hypothetical protein Q9M35_04360 [Rhodothermus sp.]|nr:hypothetical protein [Rhodothermus sp.]